MPAQPSSESTINCSSARGSNSENGSPVTAWNTRHKVIAGLSEQHLGIELDRNDEDGRQLVAQCDAALPDTEVCFVGHADLELRRNVAVLFSVDISASKASKRQSVVDFAPIRSMNSATVATVSSSTVATNAAADSTLVSSENSSVVTVLSVGAM